MKPEASTWCRANDHIFSIVHVGWLSVARVERLSNQSNRRAHAHRLGGPKLTTESGTRSAMQLVRRIQFSGGNFLGSLLKSQRAHKDCTIGPGGCAVEMRAVQISSGPPLRRSVQEGKNIPAYPESPL